MDTQINSENGISLVREYLVEILLQIHPAIVDDRDVDMITGAFPAVRTPGFHFFFHFLKYGQALKPFRISKGVLIRAFQAPIISGGHADALGEGRCARREEGGQHDNECSHETNPPETFSKMQPWIFHPSTSGNVTKSRG
ncbi:MAG: hypothetical protein JXD23_02195 [Spirochaetales bacterium]|nr:hypothetical protein [Spirochaetales bacterium]